MPADGTRPLSPLSGLSLRFVDAQEMRLLLQVRLIRTQEARFAIGLARRKFSSRRVEQRLPLRSTS
jgi:hypothetical protein